VIWIREKEVESSSSWRTHRGPQQRKVNNSCTVRKVGSWAGRRQFYIYTVYIETQGGWKKEIAKEGTK
jgi:hypothetical protein